MSKKNRPQKEAQKQNEPGSTTPEMLSVFNFCERMKIGKATRIAFQSELGVLKDHPFPIHVLEEKWKQFSNKPGV